MRSFLVLVGLLCATATFAQREWGMTGSYQYQSVTQWNEAIRTYNLARPFLDEQQPLFGSGWQVGLYGISRGEKKLNFGGVCRFSMHNSWAANPGFNVELRTMNMEAGLKMRWWPKTETGLHLEMHVTALVTTMDRLINDEPQMLELDGEEVGSRSFGVGPMLDVQVHFSHAVGAAWVLSPFAGVGVSPALVDPDSWMIINQSYTGQQADITPVYRANFGVLIGRATGGK